MKTIIKVLFAVLALSLLSGCYAIGVETISQEKFKTSSVKINDYEIRASENGGTVRFYDPSKGSYFVFPQVRYEGLSTNMIGSFYNGTAYEYYSSEKIGDLPEVLKKHNHNYGTLIKDAKTIIAMLGKPDKQSESSLIYKNGKRKWNGFAVDLAIFPIPLTIPFMLPGDKDGYIEFHFDDHEGIYIYRYGNISKMYGFYGSDYGGGFSKGTESGFWFYR